MTKMHARTRIKICGLTREEDVVAAVAAGVDACGFVFAESPRRVTVERGATLTRLVPPLVARVGVFVDAEPSFIVRAVEVCGLTAVQLCGSETPEVCSATMVPAIKVLHVGPGFAAGDAEPYRGNAAALLLDTYDSQKAGGTSQTFAWNLIGELPGWAPFLVAGGLTPHNVGDAVRTLRPFGVDVSSGVEATPGVKDPAKMAAFCAAVREADEEVSR